MKKDEKISNTLVWIDLEMTGLDPAKDQILEIATIITDNNLAVIKQGPELVIHASKEVLGAMSKQVHDLHAKSNLIDRVQESTLLIKQAEEQTLAFIKEFAEPNSILCGNSIYNDRNFLAAQMPAILEYLHYRLIDVSTIKELVKRWYPKNEHAHFEKKETHRALADILESIDELKHYRNYFFIPA